MVLDGTDDAYLGSSSEQSGSPASQGYIGSTNGWKPSPDDEAPYLLISFDQPRNITMIVTQGYNGSFVPYFTLWYQLFENGLWYEESTVSSIYVKYVPNVKLYERLLVYLFRDSKAFLIKNIDSTCFIKGTG